MVDSKLQAILSWPVPKSLRALRGFLGLTGYYRKFIRHYGMIAAPLTQLLKKDSFHWTLPADSAFQKLKEAMSSAPVLALPDFNETFVIECDASGCGMGAILMQKGKLVAYLSKSFAPSQLGMSAYEKEMEAIIFATQKWRPYLMGRKFIIKTDHQSLCYLLNQQVHTPAQQRWLVKLLGYDFQLEYKSGHHNKAADALSRICEDSSCMAVSMVMPDWVTQLQQVQIPIFRLCLINGNRDYWIQLSILIREEFFISRAAYIYIKLTP